uniref:G-protein coupled receptors family 1 profile domain-containing protein n=1 Tax=Ditylenchus dipsaci TaxID=166011 RepID=A0A915D926_9BILA
MESWILTGGCNQTNPWRPLGMVLDLWVLPVVCLLGLLLNLACLVVFTKRRNHPVVPSLILLSICDSLQLLISLFVLYLPALHDHMEMDPIGWVAQIAYLATGGLAGGLLASNCASIWTMCYIAIQRHKAIVTPLSTVTASKGGNWTLWGIGLAALLFNVPVWYVSSTLLI